MNKFLLLTAIALLTTSQAFACAGFGLSSLDTIELIKTAEKTIKSDSLVSKYEVISINWLDFTLSSGTEGDCGAKNLGASVTLVVKGNKMPFCQISGTVEVFKSRLGEYNKTDLKIIGQCI